MSEMSQETSLSHRPSTRSVPSSRTQMKERVLEVCNPTVIVTPETPLDRCPTNLDLANPKHAALAVAAMGIKDLDLDREGRLALKANYFLVYGDYMPNKDGKGYDAVTWVCLITREGTIYKTTGVFAPRAVRAAAELFSAKEWENGITFAISTRLTANKRLAHDVRIVIDNEDSVGPTV